MGALGGGLANTVGGVTSGLGNTVQAGGNMVRDGMSSEKAEASGTGSVDKSATETAKTAKGKVSEGTQAVQDKGADVGSAAEKKGKEMESKS